MKHSIVTDLCVRCPFLKPQAPGKILEIIATDEGIKKDIVSWCNSTGNELLEINEEEGEIHLFVRKSS